MPSDQTPRDLFFKLYVIATGDDDERLCRDISDSQCREQPGNFVRQILAQWLSKVGDVLADPKIVLPWLIGAVGAPTYLVGMLVPVRESLALLPQTIVGGVIRRFAVRKWFWVCASVVEGLCILAMALLALAGLRGSVAGWSIMALLVCFSLARGVASIASKDTLGKTVAKGHRGRVGGYAQSGAGFVAGAMGLYLIVVPQELQPDWVLYAMLAVAGSAWLAAAAAFATIAEVPGATDGGRSLRDIARDQWSLLLSERDLQKFLLARGLLMATSLVGPVYVALAQQQSNASLGGLGWLLLASGLASALSSSVWGSLSDRSSRATMAIAAAIAAVLGVLVLTLLHTAPALTQHVEFYAAVLFVLNVAHAGARIGRKTHAVDIAEGDRKTEYVAVSNTVIGVLLLLVGGMIAGLLAIGPQLAIAVLSLMALGAALAAMWMQPAQ